MVFVSPQKPIKYVKSENASSFEAEKGAEETRRVRVSPASPREEIRLRGRRKSLGLGGESPNRSNEMPRLWESKCIK